MTNFILKYYCHEQVSPSAVVAAMKALEADLGIQFSKMVFAGGKLKDITELSPGVEAGMQSGLFPTFSNGDGSSPVTFAGMKLPDILGPAKQPVWYFYCTFKSSRNDFEALVLKFGAASKAIWGTLSSKQVETQTRLQQQDWIEEEKLMGLPRLFAPENFSSVNTPANLGWINYWSHPALEVMTNVDPSEFDYYSTNESGAVVAKISEEVLDFSNPEHLNRMILLYNTTPVVGGRKVPE